MCCLQANKKAVIKKSLFEIFLFFIWVLIAGDYTSAFGDTGKELRFQIKVTGGMARLAVGEWNTYMDQATRLQNDLGNLFGNEVQGNFERIRVGPELEGEVILCLTPRIGISLGTGYIWGKQGPDRSRIFIKSRTGQVDMTHETEISAVPVTVGACYTFSVLPKVNVYAAAGLGYYFARWSDVYFHQLIGVWQEKATQSAKGGGLGVNARVGLEYEIAKNLALVVQASARYAKIKELKGQYDYENSGGWIDYYTGTLQYYEQDYTYLGAGWTSVVKILKEPYESPAYRNMKKAALDFSGFSLQVGIKVNF